MFSLVGQNMRRQGCGEGYFIHIYYPVSKYWTGLTHGIIFHPASLDQLLPGHALTGFILHPPLGKYAILLP